MASSWRVLVDAEKVIIWVQRQCIPSKLHKPLALEYGVTSQKTVILIYPIGTRYIISKDFTSQQPSLSHSLASFVRCTEPGSGRFVAQHHSFLSLLCSLHRFLHEAKQRTAPKEATKVWDVPCSQTWRSALAKRPWIPSQQIYQLTNSRTGRTAGAQYKKPSFMLY